MSEQLGHAQSTISLGLKKLGKVKKLGHWVPHKLSRNDKNWRVDCCLNIMSLERRMDWLKDLITGDEK